MTGKTATDDVWRTAAQELRLAAAALTEHRDAILAAQLRIMRLADQLEEGHRARRFVRRED